MKNIPLLLGVLLGTVAFVVVISLLFAKQVNAPGDPVRILGDGHNATGSAQAKVTVVEFSDFQCPACKLAEPIVKDLLQKYPTEVRVIFRHYPLTTVHPNSTIAAYAGETAASVGKFWPYHDILYSKQSDWAGKSNDEAAKMFVQYAKDLGIPEVVMTKGLTDPKIAEVVGKDVADGTAIGVNATPTFYVNGKATEPQSLSSAVDDLLR